MSDDAMYVPTGNGTEVGLMNFLADNEISIYDLFKQRESECVIETDIPFSSIRKRQLIAIRNVTKEEDKVKVIVKGAPEYVMLMCTSMLNQ